MFGVPSMNGADREFLTCGLFISRYRFSTSPRVIEGRMENIAVKFAAIFLTRAGDCRPCLFLVCADQSNDFKPCS